MAKDFIGFFFMFGQDPLTFSAFLVNGYDQKLQYEAFPSSIVLRYQKRHGFYPTVNAPGVHMSNPTLSAHINQQPAFRLWQIGSIQASH
jgi:hypothetical protein